MLPPSCENLYLKECSQVQYEINDVHSSGDALDLIFHSLNNYLPKPPGLQVVPCVVREKWPRKILGASHPQVFV